MSSSARLKKDFTEGPIFFKITLFVLPIMLRGILQICYGMADNIVVGRFSSDPTALAAVGTTGSLINLMIALLMGIAGGVGIVISQLYGAKNFNPLSRAVHTAMVFSVIGGVVFSIGGLAAARGALEIMEVKEELLEGATLYVRIRAVGFLASAVYNFGASILGAAGDSKTPLLILASTGLVNVILNVVFVICLGMTVDGVATATVISEYLSAVIVVIVLMKRKSEPYAFSLKKLCFDTPQFMRMLKIGIPAGVQSALFGIANTTLISAVNTFPTSTVTAYTIAGNIDGISYTTMNSFSQAAATFTGQNYGARNYERVKKSFLYSLLQVTVVGVLICQLLLLTSHFVMGLYIDPSATDKDAIVTACDKILKVMLNTYVFCGIMEVLSGTLRGFGNAFAPMLVNLLCTCGFRLLWANFVFPLDRFNSIIGLMLVYPLSWTITYVPYAPLLVRTFKRFKSETKADGVGE